MKAAFFLMVLVGTMLRSAVPLRGKGSASAILYKIEMIDLDTNQIVFRYWAGDHWSPAFVTFNECTQIVSSCLKGTAGIEALEPGQQCYLDFHWEDGVLVADRILVVEKHSVLDRRPLLRNQSS